MIIISLLFPALMACLVLTGIHTYLGLHVVRRGVIFVDIALGQIAALGMSIAFLMGHELDSQTAYFFALGASMSGALLLTVIDHPRIPHEAFIGVTFALASALCIILADKSPHGAEHLKFILNGNILWASPYQILKAAFIYFLLGIIHFKFRKQLMAVSTDRQAAIKQGIKVWKWDLLFYLTFSIVITSSVQMAGILLVFSILIVPALIGYILATTWQAQLFIGWITGVIVSLLGLFFSLKWDLPTGASLVCVFGVTLMLIVILQILSKKRGCNKL